MVRDADAEHAILTTESGRALLAEVAAVPRPGPAELARWRRDAPAEHVAAALRLAECRRRGASKFARAEAMWLEPTALEQATAEAVARHKARRFAGETTFDLCSGIGGDALAIAGLGRVVAVDRDAAHARRLRWNADVYGVADRLLAVVGRAERVAVPAGVLVHIDPDRRARTDRPARSITAYAPGLDFLLGLAGGARGGAIKLGPASDFAAHFGGPGFEVELISLGGECKEAAIWFGDRATCRRRATALPAGITWTDRDAPADAPRRVAPVDSWLFDPDPALDRAGLLDGFAAAHGLARVEPAFDLLTGPAPVASPWLARFELAEALPADLKRLRRAVADRRLGPLEIKTYGADLTPETLRARLRPPGPEPATLLLVGGRPGRALLARRA